MAAADFDKLVQNMRRASQISARAATDATKHASIMDNFERRLELNSAQMGKIEEYEKLMAEMDKLGDNGGPPLVTTFPSSTASPPPVLQSGGSTVASTSISRDIPGDRNDLIIRGRFHASGRQI